MYRGWYKGKRDLGSAAVPWELLPGRVELAVPRRPGLPDQRGGEGEPALGGQASSAPASSGTAGTTPTRWVRRLRRRSTRSWPCTSPTTGARSAPGACRRQPVGARRFTGSCATAWTQGRKEFKVDWDQPAAARLQPGLHRRTRYETMDTAYERSDWVPTPAAQALIRNNMPLLAYIARQAGSASPARTTTSCPARPSRSSSSSSTTRASR